MLSGTSPSGTSFNLLPFGRQKEGRPFVDLVILTSLLSMGDVVADEVDWATDCVWDGALDTGCMGRLDDEGIEDATVFFGEIGRACLGMPCGLGAGGLGTGGLGACGL